MCISTNHKKNNTSYLFTLFPNKGEFRKSFTICTNRNIIVTHYEYDYKTFWRNPTGTQFVM